MKRMYLSKAGADFTGSEAPLLPSSIATIFVSRPQMITPSWAENIINLMSGKLTKMQKRVSLQI